MGQFDIGVFGALLLHLSNPFKALAQAARLIDDALVVTDIDNAPVLPGQPRDHEDYPALLAFNEGKLPFGIVHWWSFSPAAIARMLARLGFEDVRIDTHIPPGMEGKTSLFTVVGRRAKRVQVAVPPSVVAALPLPPAQARFWYRELKMKTYFSIWEQKVSKRCRIRCNTPASSPQRPAACWILVAA